MIDLAKYEGHTPGPWRATSYGVRDDGGFICALHWPTKYDGQDERYRKEPAERQADADLITDAPMLLATLVAERARYAELVAAAVDYFGPMDDPSIGWVGHGASHKDLFKCEKCGAESNDTAAIPHIGNCRAVRLRDSLLSCLAALGPQS